MTRQWLADPNIMCMNHLTGEHAEAHMFLSKMERGYSLKGFYEESEFFGAIYLKMRHDLIAEMLDGHKTPLTIDAGLEQAYPLAMPQMANLKKSLGDLLNRCSKCRYNFHTL